jgi:hypothetical protein
MGACRLHFKEAGKAEEDERADSRILVNLGCHVMNS